MQRLVGGKYVLQAAITIFGILTGQAQRRLHIR